MVKSQSPDPPFISHYAIIQGEMGLFLTFSVFELQRGYLYQNGVEFRQKVIGAGLNLFWGHLHYFSGGIWTFPLLSDTYASAPIAERAISSKLLAYSSNLLYSSPGTIQEGFKNCGIFRIRPKFQLKTKVRLKFWLESKIRPKPIQTRKIRPKFRLDRKFR